MSSTEGGEASAQSDNLRSRVQQHIRRSKECLTLMRDLQELPDVVLCATFDDEHRVSCISACQWRQSLHQSDLSIWLELLRRLARLGALLPEAELLTVIQNLQQHPQTKVRQQQQPRRKSQQQLPNNHDLANLAADVLRDLYSFVGRSSITANSPGHEAKSITRPSVRQSSDQVANSRHSKAQRRLSSCTVAATTLLDVVIEAARLSDLLPADAQKALAAVSRDFRETFISQIQVVTVATREDVALVLQRSWPRLSMIVLRNGFLWSFDVGNRSQANIQLTSSTSREFASIVLLRPLKTPLCELALASTAAKQLAHQLTIKWPQLTILRLENLTLPRLSTAILTELNDKCWPSLQELQLCQAGLTGQDWLLLSQGKYPTLQLLSVMGDGLDAEGMALLVQGSWPGLRRLILGATTLDAVAIAHLSAANWPLSGLMACMAVTSDMAAELAKLQLSSLTHLRLQGSGLTAAALYELAKADWPMLQVLDLSHNDLDVAALQHLSKMPLPALLALNLTDAHINEEGAIWVARGSWPLLKCLQMEKNPLGRTGMQHLTQGSWPVLQSFSVSHDVISQDHDTDVLLGLKHEKVQVFVDKHVRVDHFHVFAHHVVYYQIPRVITHASAGIWPHLKQVTAITHLRQEVSQHDLSMVLCTCSHQKAIKLWLSSTV